MGCFPLRAGIQVKKWRFWLSGFMNCFLAQVGGENDKVGEFNTHVGRYGHFRFCDTDHKILGFEALVCLCIEQLIVAI